MINYKDFEKNGVIDWEAYHLSEIEAGEICYDCRKATIPFSTKHGKQLCHSCQLLIQDKEEVSHTSKIRCPMCKEVINIPESSDYGAEFYEGGGHEYECDNCQSSFEVITEITYTFTSPPLVDDPIGTLSNEE